MVYIVIALYISTSWPQCVMDAHEMALCNKSDAQGYIASYKGDLITFLNLKIGNGREYL